MARTVAKDHDQKRRAILKTATTLFSRNGYDRSSMSDLALECGVSKALIYHYYNSKESILFDILNNHIGSLLASVRNAELSPDAPAENLHLLVATLLERYRDADDEHRLQLEAMSALTQEQQRQLADLQRQLVQVFADVIKAVHPDLFQTQKHHLIPVTMSLFAMMNWLYQWHRPGKGVSRAEYGRLATDILLGGVLNLPCEQKLTQA